MEPKCSICGSPAVAYEHTIRAHLCGTHFTEFVERRVSRTVEKYKMLRGVKRLVVAVSGGKDSVTLLRIMHKLYGEHLELLGVTIDLGISGYSGGCVEAAVRNFEALGVEYRVVRLGDYGFSIDDVNLLNRRRVLRRPVCSVCGMVKRYMINKVALELGADAVATGHNLNDLLLFSLMDIMSASFSELSKLRPKTPTSGKLISRVRPLIFLTDKHTLLYALLNNVPFNPADCPYAPQRGIRVDLLRALDKVEEGNPGFKLALALGMLKLAGKLHVPEAQEGIGECKLCGMPTGSPGLCSFCKLRSQVLRAREVVAPEGQGSSA